MSHAQPLNIRGFKIFKSFIDTDSQLRLVEEIRKIAVLAPMFHPTTRFGNKMSVKMTSAGCLGWVSDVHGYRYEKSHPNGNKWPELPKSILEIWSQVTKLKGIPNSCLVNYYTEQAKMGLHQDKDEGDFSYPVVSISLGDDGLFRIGNTEKGGKTESVWLNSGDISVMGGDARLKYHGIDRIRFGSSTLLKKGGRLNLTLRVVRY